MATSFSSPIMADISPLIATLEVRVQQLNQDHRAAAPLIPEVNALVEQIRSIKNIQMECSGMYREYQQDKSNTFLTKEIEQKLQERDKLIALFQISLQTFLKATKLKA